MADIDMAEARSLAAEAAETLRRAIAINEATEARAAAMDRRLERMERIFLASATAVRTYMWEASESGEPDSVLLPDVTVG